ncbi:MAG: dTDP-4-dehydrorhamnose 3,5-epimerase [Candidatus Tectomicrobia bacterium]|nr:dTDP-4-dehydrorhamnose 3,5-epimerase [Candidatus Tectomicrobia bacterium]
MHFSPTALPDAYIIDLQPHQDERGFFARAWCQQEFAKYGLSTQLAQCNMALSHRAGTLRGMHYQISPHEESKLVRCTKGALYDVIIDLRLHSVTYLQWIGVELTANNYRMLYVPEGFAHGYQTLCDETEVFYQVSQCYQPGAEQAVRWNDPAFSIEWPETNDRTMSDKDRNWPDFSSQIIPQKSR